MTQPEEWLAENPEYVDELEKILNYREEWDGWGEVHIEDEEYDFAFDYKKVGVSPNDLYQMETAGIISRVFDSNSTTAYALEEVELAENAQDAVAEAKNQSTPRVMHDFPSEEDLPDGLFDDVIGYDDIKWLLKRGLTTQDITNFLLIGPPGSAKTVFLLCIRELEGAHFIPATDASSSGFMEMMFEEQPKYLLFDELDDMDKEYQKSLSSFTENGIVKESKYNKTREMETNTKTFASANAKSGILNHIRDRFITLEFEPYSKGEFVDVCRHLLPKRRGVNEEEAKMIAEEVYEQEGSGRVRKALAVATLSRGDPKKVIGVLEDYSDNGSSLL